jgi:hypothetical protein
MVVLTAKGSPARPKENPMTKFIRQHHRRPLAQPAAPAAPVAPVAPAKQEQAPQAPTAGPR